MPDEGGGNNRFLVPQYIETEPKILGPITVRQFILILLGGMVSFVVWKIFENSNQNLGILILVLQYLIWLLFAFTTINGQKFHYFMLNIVKTAKKPKLRVWKKKISNEIIKEALRDQGEVMAVKKLPPKSRLSDISLLVDTGGAYNIDDEMSNEKIDGVEDMNI